MAETVKAKEERNALGQVMKEPTTELHNSLGGYYIPYFKIPQVRFTHTKKRSKNKDITAMKYKIDKNGFHGEGCTNQLFDIVRKGFQCQRNQNSIVKLTPDEFNKETFDEKVLASPEGRYFSLGFNNAKSIVAASVAQSNVYLTGPMGEFEEFDEKELIIGDYDQEFQLVYQGKTFEVDGLVCVKADIELNGKEIIPGPTDHIYEITSTNDRLLSISTLLSPFAEDDNCVRVVVLPCQSEGMILQPGDVLGTLKIVKPEDFERVKEVYLYTSNILANLWMIENKPPKFLSKLQFQDLVKEWHDNKQKNAEDVRQKKEALSEQKKKNRAEDERVRQAALERKEKKKAEHLRILKEHQEISAKKKEAKREAAKQKQAEDMRRKQKKLFWENRNQLEQELANPVFGKPMEFGKPSGPPSSSHKPVCKHYSQGKCEWGARCKFYHPEEEKTLSHGSKQNKKRSSTSGSDSFGAKLPRVDGPARRVVGVDSPASRASGFSGGYSDRGHGFSDRKGSFSERGGGYSNRKRGLSDRGSGSSGSYGLSSFGNNRREDKNEFFKPSSMMQHSSNSSWSNSFNPMMGSTSSNRFERKSGFLFEEHRIPVDDSSHMSLGVQNSRLVNKPALSDERRPAVRNIDLRGGPVVPAMGAGINHVKDIEMERLEVQMRKKKLMEDILNSQKELLKLESAEGELLKRKSGLF